MAKPSFGGGLNAGSAELTRLVLASAVSFGRTISAAMGALFVDVKSAFASMPRQAVLPVRQYSQIATRLTQLGLPSRIANDIAIETDRWLH